MELKFNNLLNYNPWFIIAHPTIVPYASRSCIVHNKITCMSKWTAPLNWVASHVGILTSHNCFNSSDNGWRQTSNASPIIQFGPRMIIDNMMKYFLLSTREVYCSPRMINDNMMKYFLLSTREVYCSPRMINDNMMKYFLLSTREVYCSPRMINDNMMKYFLLSTREVYCSPRMINDNMMKYFLLSTREVYCSL